MSKVTRIRQGAVAKTATQHGDQNSVPQGSVDVSKLAADVLALLLPTGVSTFYEGLTAPAGWILGTGTIGNSSSGATTRAAEDTRNLYRLYWNDYANAQAPVSGGRGASADADFDAGKTISVPDTRGRLPFVLDNLGGSAASRTTSTTVSPDGNTLGATGGAQTHLLTAAQSGLPAHSHTVGTTASYSNGNAPGSYLAGGSAITPGPNNPMTGAIANSNSATNASQAHNNMPPTIGKSFIVKL